MDTTLAQKNHEAKMKNTHIFSNARKINKNSQRNMCGVFFFYMATILNCLTIGSRFRVPKLFVFLLLDVLCFTLMLNPAEVFIG